jgi:hypothetical protein
MKKLLLVFFIFFTVSAYSQTISYGISAGLNYTNLPGNGRLNYYSLTDKYITGFRVGGLMDIKHSVYNQEYYLPQQAGRANLFLQAPIVTFPIISTIK